MQVDRQNAFLYLWGFCLAKQTDNIETKTCGRSLNFLKFILSALPETTLPLKKMSNTRLKFITEQTSINGRRSMWVILRIKPAAFHRND